MYGKNAHPYYIAQGVIDGWEEFAWIKNTGPAKSLHELLKCPQVVGVWTWARGDGWAGPYTPNELWVDLNIQVFTRFYREPWKSEEELFNDAARVRFGVKGDDLKKLRELCLLSASAVMRGQESVHVKVSEWWCRDEYLTAIDLKSVVEGGENKRGSGGEGGSGKKLAKDGRLVAQYPSAKQSGSGISGSVHHVWAD